MKCVICKRTFREGEQVIPVQRYVVNEKRGDFVGTNANIYIHLKHVTETEMPPDPEIAKRARRAEKNRLLTERVAEVEKARVESHDRYESNDFACRYCGHAISQHNRMEGCENCRCAGSPGEVTPQSDSELRAKILSKSLYWEEFSPAVAAVVASRAAKTRRKLEQLGVQP